MTDSKQKCQGCGAETMSDVGWCLACRSILYTPLQIAESDFRRSEFKTMVFPVRDVVWLQERVRLRDAEIKAMDTVNDEMGATILSLRADLAEARADVQRFEQALDVANRELAEARKQRDFAKDGEDNMRFLKVLLENECGFYRAQSVARLHEIDMSRRTIRALVVAARAGVQSVYSIAQGSWGTKETCINLLRAHVASADALYHYKRGSVDSQVMHD